MKINTFFSYVDLINFNFLVNFIILTQFHHSTKKKLHLWPPDEDYSCPSPNFGLVDLVNLIFLVDLNT